MKPWELFDHIWDVDYNKSGFDLDWLCEVDDQEKVVRLMFEPSTSTKDWFINIAGFIPFLWFPFFFCWGWKTVFDGCRDLIFEEFLRKINLHKSYKVLICGHSYGGAMSVIAGLELYKRTKIKADVITFGAPMPLFLFWSKFIARLELGEVIQWAHWSDLVTYCPPIPGLHNVRVKRIGKFSFKALLDASKTHMSYGDKELYPEG